ncbi:MAG: hypothetical protein U5R48_18410 [Gammaproteobacteria bacterium]|nr:hypothetical protein [Gammaproteobacteria bacterium]
MRTLTNEEVDQVSGGNLTTVHLPWSRALRCAGAPGWSIGQSINDFNDRMWGMSLGEAVYRQLH